MALQYQARERRVPHAAPRLPQGHAASTASATVGALAELGRDTCGDTHGGDAARLGYYHLGSLPGPERLQDKLRRLLEVTVSRNTKSGILKR